MNKFSDSALDILKERYYLKNERGNYIEKSPEELFRRVAKFVASAEELYSNDIKKYEDRFFKAMIKQEFMPASPVLFNAGTDIPMLSSCFTLSVDDNMESIMGTLTDSAFIFKYGGGAGWNFSKLRAKDSPLTSGGSSSGVCSFISLYDTLIETIKQGGKRKGAGAAILDVNHQDIKEFILIKRDNKTWSNMNISVICDDVFMDKVFANDKESLDIWNLICESNWHSGDPNIIFIDRMNEYNTLPNYPIDTVNPCHEICAPPNSSCNLAGINLDKCLKGGKGNSKLDWDKLGKLVKMGHRFLDNMIDIGFYPVKIIEEFAKSTRRQGLYMFGLAPMLIKLGLRYGSQESLDFIDNLFCYINRVSLESCIDLGRERGNFPLFNESIFKDKYKYMRCSNRLTIAPSGTTSRIADSYFSIEPYYAFEYISNIMDKSTREKFIIKEEYKDLYPDALVTAHDLSPEEHLRVMSSVGRWIDQSISKTVNVPYEFTKDEISMVFKLAFKYGLKAVSVYRTGCKDKQVLEENNIVYKDKRKIHVDEKYLRYLYEDKKYSRAQIAEILGVSNTVVVLRLKEYGIPLRKYKGGKLRHVYKPTVDVIKDLHNRGVNYSNTSAVYDKKVDFINDIIKESDTVIGNNLDRSIPLTPFIIEFIEGELLGDGCIMPTGNSKNPRMAYYTHSSQYYEYVEWLDSIFSSEGLVISGNIIKDDMENSTVYRYSTIACIELMELRKRWYGVHGEKQVPENLEFTPIIVRQWFIGDGVRKSDGAVYFCTQCFNKKSIEILSNNFKQIGIPEFTLTKRNEMYIKKRYVTILYNYMDSAFFADAPCYNYKFPDKDIKLEEPIECKNGTCSI